MFFCFRIYDITRPEQPMMRLPLFDDVSQSSSKNRFTGFLGNMAADFSIAEPIDSCTGSKIYPVYVMQESGDVWVLHCKFTQNRYVALIS